MSNEVAENQENAKEAVTPAVVAVRLGNIFDTFVKQMFGQILIFIDFLLNYADPIFVSKIDLDKIEAAPTH